jgi:hypothetical protein
MEKDQIRNDYYKNLTAFERQKIDIDTIEFQNRIIGQLIATEEAKARKKEYWQEQRRIKEEEHRAYVEQK